VKDLQRLFSLPYRLDYDGKKLVANRDEVSEAIQVNFKVELSEDERKYYGLVANVVNALNEMQDFEKEHGYVQFSYMELIVEPSTDISAKFCQCHFTKNLTNNTSLMP
jgi:hypothetical protein